VPAGLGAPLLAAENLGAVGSVPGNGFNCGAVATPDFASGPMPPGPLKPAFGTPRLRAVALASGLASPALIETGAASWDVGGLGMAPTAAAASSGGGVTRNCVGGGGLLIGTGTLLAACETGAAAAGSATCGLLFEGGCASDSESAADLEVDLGAGCKASGTLDLGLILAATLAPLFAPD